MDLVLFLKATVARKIKTPSWTTTVPPSSSLESPERGGSPANCPDQMGLQAHVVVVVVCLDC